MFQSDALRILIADGMACSKLVVDTVLHEISHAIFWTAGVGHADDEERLVSTIATAWTQVFRDNPWLPGWISQFLA